MKSLAKKHQTDVIEALNSTPRLDDLLNIDNKYLTGWLTKFIRLNFI